MAQMPIHRGFAESRYCHIEVEPHSRTVLSFYCKYTKFIEMLYYSTSILTLITYWYTRNFLFLISQHHQNGWNADIQRDWGGDISGDVCDVFFVFTFKKRWKTQHFLWVDTITESHSHAGNDGFPRWEWWIPTLGISRKVPLPWVECAAFTGWRYGLRQMG